MNNNAAKRTIQIISVPIDLGASRRGTDAGPSALRVAGLGEGLLKIGFDLAKQIDIAVPSMESRHSDSYHARFKKEIFDVCSALALATESSLVDGYIPLVIGGDHSIAMGTVSGVASYYKKQGANLGLLWFDAHGDMNLPSTSLSGNIHGMPLAHLLGYGDKLLTEIYGNCPTINPENVALIGIRDIDAKEREVIRNSGIKTFSMRKIDELGMTQVCNEALEIVTSDTAGFHVSFDVDGCDPEVIPGSGTLVPGGVSYREAHLLLERCADTRQMLSMEVVELNPFLDHGNISAERVVGLIKSAFGSSIL